MNEEFFLALRHGSVGTVTVGVLRALLWSVA